MLKMRSSFLYTLFDVLFNILFEVIKNFSYFFIVVSKKSCTFAADRLAGRTDNQKRRWRYTLPPFFGLCLRSSLLFITQTSMFLPL
jgi:hypothetical protein